MRDIRFRAWDKDRSKMWNTITIESIDFARNRLTVLYDLNITPDGQNSGIYSDTLGRFELMQYTGLKDKNGKEIYEGDIMNDHRGINRLVIYDPEFASFHVVKEIGDDDPTPLFEWDHFEVIGNIYENPELIKDTAAGGRT